MLLVTRSINRNETPLRLHFEIEDPSTVALGTMYPFVIFSSLNNLKLAPLTGPLRMAKEAFLEEKTSLLLFNYLISCRASC